MCHSKTNKRGSKEKRAEQNRKAQQAFRRRREEHMRDLERDAAALAPTKKRLEEVERSLREFTLVSNSHLPCYSFTT